MDYVPSPIAGIIASHSPLMLATWSFGQPAIGSAWDLLAAGGSALDAAERACRHAETDLTNPTVGVGGYPDRDGAVSVDAAVMLSPAQCAGICASRSAIHPITLARSVMEHSRHKMIAGPGADQFAIEHGQETGSLLIESSRVRWEEWKQSGETSAPVANMEENHDTIGVLAIDLQGEVAACCSTSGLSWKLPGRVGDSSIIGQGLYADPGVGCCVCTGHGELVMGVCGSFLAVETLRRGGSPRDAVFEVLKRIASSYTLGDQDQVGVIVLAANGTFSSGALRPGFQISVRDLYRDEVMSPEVVLIER